MLYQIKSRFDGRVLFECMSGVYDLAGNFLDDEWTRRPRPENADVQIRDLAERIQRVVDEFFMEFYP